MGEAGGQHIFFPERLKSHEVEDEKEEDFWVVLL